MKAPSFKGLRASSVASSRVKQRNQSTNTVQEVLLRQALWRMGLRYRKNVKTLPGKPDIVFSGPRVVVFCDGDFWHGRNWSTLEGKLALGHNPSYWPAKIAQNMERDRKNTEALEHGGWLVVRIWESEIKKDPLAVAVQINELVRARSRRSG